MGIEIDTYTVLNLNTLTMFFCFLLKMVLKLRSV